MLSKEDLFLDAHDENEYSTEGWRGAAYGFVAGAVIAFNGAFIAGGPAGLLVANGVANAGLKADREKLKHDILTISERISKARNGRLEEAEREGTKLGNGNYKKMSKLEIAKSAIMGVPLGAFYASYQGHKYEEDKKLLNKKIEELKATFIEERRAAIAASKKKK